MGAAHHPLAPKANFGVWSGQETVFVVNDNGGRGFDFEKVSQDETWVTRDALAQIGVNNPPINTSAGVDHAGAGINQAY